MKGNSQFNWDEAYKEFLEVKKEQPENLSRPDIVDAIESALISRDIKAYISAIGNLSEYFEELKTQIDSVVDSYDYSVDLKMAFEKDFEYDFTPEDMVFES